MLGLPCSVAGAPGSSLSLSRCGLLSGNFVLFDCFGCCGFYCCCCPFIIRPSWCLSLLFSCTPLHHGITKDPLHTSFVPSSISASFSSLPAARSRTKRIFTFFSTDFGKLAGLPIRPHLCRLKRRTLSTV